MTRRCRCPVLPDHRHVPLSVGFPHDRQRTSFCLVSPRPSRLNELQHTWQRAKPVPVCLLAWQCGRQSCCGGLAALFSERTAAAMRFNQDLDDRGGKSSQDIHR